MTRDAVTRDPILAEALAAYLRAPDDRVASRAASDLVALAISPERREACGEIRRAVQALTFIGIGELAAAGATVAAWRAARTAIEEILEGELARVMPADRGAA